MRAKVPFPLTFMITSCDFTADFGNSLSPSLHDWHCDYEREGGGGFNEGHEWWTRKDRRWDSWKGVNSPLFSIVSHAEWRQTWSERIYLEWHDKKGKKRKINNLMCWGKRRARCNDFWRHSIGSGGQIVMIIISLPALPVVDYPDTLTHLYGNLSLFLHCPCLYVNTDCTFIFVLSVLS